MILFIEFVYLKSLYLQAKFKLKKPEVEKQKAMCLNHPFLLSGSENTWQHVQKICTIQIIICTTCTQYIFIHVVCLDFIEMFEIK